MSAEPAEKAEWDMAATEESAPADRILNQDEIDSLLGFSMEEESGAKRGGVRALINSALVSYERLPMLEVVFDRLVRLMTTSLRNVTSDNVAPSLVRCRRFVVRGDVRFGGGVTVVGDVTVRHDGPGQLVVAPGTALAG